METNGISPSNSDGQCGGQETIAGFSDQTTPHSNSSRVSEPSPHLAPFSLEALLEEDPFVTLDSQSPPNNWFLLLKNKIINTDKLIKRYQVKNRKIKDLQTSLTGLKKELKLLHKENVSNLTLIHKLRKQMEKGRNLEEEQRVYIEQLTAKVEELETRGNNEMSTPSVDFVKKDKQALKAEINRLKRENRKLTKELRKYMRMATSVSRPEGCVSSPINSPTTTPVKQRMTKLSRQQEEISTSTEESEDTVNEDNFCLPEEANEELCGELTMEDIAKDKGFYNESGGNEMDELKLESEIVQDTDHQDMEDNDSYQPGKSSNTQNLPEERERRPKRTLSESSYEEDLCESKRPCPEIGNNEWLQGRDLTSMPTLTGGIKEENETEILRDMVDMEMLREADDVELFESGCLSDEIFENECEEMMATLKLNYTTGSSHLIKALTPLPPSPPDSPLPTFDFFRLPSITPLPPSPHPLPLSHIATIPTPPEQSLETASVMSSNDVHTSDHTSLSICVNEPIPKTDMLVSSEQYVDELHQLTDQMHCDVDLHGIKETTSPSNTISASEQATPTMNVLLSDKQPKLPCDNSVIMKQTTPPILCKHIEERVADSMVKGKKQFMSCSNEEEATPQIEEMSVTIETNIMQMSLTETTPPISSSLLIVENRSILTVSDGLDIDQLSSEDTQDSQELVIDADIGGFLSNEKRECLSKPIEYEEGELVEDDTVDVFTVGYSNPSPKLEVCPPTKNTKKLMKQLVTDGATGQFMKEATPSESCGSSRSTSPLLGNIAMEFPSVDSQAVSQAPPTQPVCQAPPAQRFCQAQKSLNELMSCPMALPPWLAEALLQTQDQMPKGDKAQMKKKQKIPPQNRPKGIKMTNYTLQCLEFLINGKLSLSKCITMIANPKNVRFPAPFSGGLLKLIKSKYFPPFESVMQLCWKRCSGVVGKTLDPMDPNYIPPLSIQEALIVSLVLNIQQLRPDMSGLLYTILNSFKEAILSPNTDFHSKCALCRLYSSFCRVLTDLEQSQFLVCDILLQSMAIDKLPLVVAMVSVWPKAFARNTFGPPLFLNGSLNTKGLEYQPLSFTLETVWSLLAHQNHQDSKMQKGPISNARILCKWELVSPTVVNPLLASFLEILKLSPFIRIETPPTGTDHQVARPRPSKHAYAIVMALQVLAASQGWAWTNDTMIRQHLWPLLQTWNKNPSSVRAETIVCVIRLLGFIGQKGLVSDPNSLPILQLQKVFAVILQKASSADSKVTLPIQLSAADALLDICPKTHSNYKTVHASIATWTTWLFKRKETSTYGVEYRKIIFENK